MTLKNIWVVLGVAAIAALGGCGGGGSSSTTSNSTSTSTSTSSPSPTGGSSSSSATAPQDSVPTPTYPADSAPLAIFNQLNSVRKLGGFGLLAQDTYLDKSAGSHASYLITNYFTAPTTWSSAMGQPDPATGVLNAHVENPNKAGFTGIRTADRAKVAGGTFVAVTEVVDESPKCLEQFLDTVFHRDSLLNRSLQRIGIANTLTPGNQSLSCVIDMGSVTTMAAPAPDWLGEYPAVGQTGVPVSMGGEAPDPAPDIVSKGSPVTIYLPSALGSVTSFTLSASGSTQPVATRRLTRNEFPTYIGANTVHLLPLAPLAYSTLYTASFVGTTTDGTVVKKTWSFTTDAQQSVSVNVSSTTLRSGTPITASTSGGSGQWSSLYVYSSYQYYGSLPVPAPTFADISYVNPTTLTITRNSTPCTPGRLVNCVVVVVGYDGTGQKGSVTIPVE